MPVVQEFLPQQWGKQEVIKSNLPTQTSYLPQSPHLTSCSHTGLPPTPPCREQLVLFRARDAWPSNSPDIPNAFTATQGVPIFYPPFIFPLLDTHGS